MSTEQLQPSDIHSMSEDELSKLDITQFENQPEEEGTQAPEPVPEEQEAPEPEEPEVEPETTEEPVEEEEPTEPEPEVDPAKEGGDKTANPQDKASEADPKQPDSTDYKALYSQIVGTPIKANGKEITINSPEEAIQLIQFGANYHQKMAALKPIRKAAGMLEQNGIRDEADIGFLIDLHNKNPEAIARLVKDSGIDIYSLDMDNAGQYQTQQKGISDNQLDLQDTINDLKSTHTDFEPFLTGLTGSWDEASQNELAANPHAIRILHTAYQQGNYQKVMQQIESDIRTGRIPANVPMMQAYRHYETEMLNAGMLHSAPAPVQKPVPATQAAPLSALKKQPAEDPNKRRAASPRTAPKTKAVTPANIHLLSEAEFAKIDPTKF